MALGQEQDLVEGSDRGFGFTSFRLLPYNRPCAQG